MTTEMLSYIGTKTLKACPMNKLDYCTYRSWVIPDKEDPFEEGYLVEYSDGGKPNDSRHAGYISWSPKDTFEKSYICMFNIERLPPHQQRVIGEAAELRVKLTSLNSFFGTVVYSSLTDDEQKRLSRQSVVMKEYLEILDERIANF